MFYSKFLVLSLLAVGSLASVLEFDANRFAGKWYELYRSKKFPFSSGSNTTVTVFAPERNAARSESGIQVRVKEYSTEYNRWHENVARSEADPFDSYKFNMLFLSHAADYNIAEFKVIYTDYDTLATIKVTATRFDSTEPRKYAWILARSLELSIEDEEKAFTSLFAVGFFESDLHKTAHNVTKEDATEDTGESGPGGKQSPPTWYPESITFVPVGFEQTTPKDVDMDSELPPTIDYDNVVALTTASTPITFKPEVFVYPSDRKPWPGSWQWKQNSTARPHSNWGRKPLVTSYPWSWNTRPQAVTPRTISNTTARWSFRRRDHMMPPSPLSEGMWKRFLPSNDKLAFGSIFKQRQNPVGQFGRLRTPRPLRFGSQHIRNQAPMFVDTKAKVPEMIKKSDMFSRLPNVGSFRGWMNPMGKFMNVNYKPFANSYVDSRRSAFNSQTPNVANFPSFPTFRGQAANWQPFDFMNFF